MINLLNEFSNYLRKSFNASNTDEIVPLEDELDLVYSYLNIEQVRFADRLEVIFNIDDLSDLYVPPLSVQTIVENALKHGVLSKLEGGKLEIILDRKKEEAKLSIKDNGNGFPQEQIDDLLERTVNEADGIGLINTNIRMKRLFGHPLEVLSELEKGTEVIFTLPYIKND